VEVERQIVKIFGRNRGRGRFPLRTETWLRLPIYLIRTGDVIEDPANQAGWIVETCEPIKNGRILWRLRAGTYVHDVWVANQYWVLRPENITHHEKVV
jgi:hypothetical protein